MSYEDQINKAVKRAIAAAKRKADVELRETMTKLHPYFADEMQPATQRNYKIGAGSTYTAKAINEIRNARRNKTDKLYTLHGNLRRALMSKGRGNISKTEAGSDGTMSATIGIDTEIVKYAAIHEFGGTINHPGGTKYAVRKGGAIFVKKGAKKFTGITKAHTITIKARPYFNPALKKYTDEDKETMQNILEAAIVAWNE